MIISLQQIKEMKLTHLDRGVKEDSFYKKWEDAVEKNTIWFFVLQLQHDLFHKIYDFSREIK